MGYMSILKVAFLGAMGLAPPPMNGSVPGVGGFHLAGQDFYGVKYFTCFQKYRMRYFGTYDTRGGAAHRAPQGPFRDI